MDLEQMDTELRSIDALKGEIIKLIADYPVHIRCVALAAALAQTLQSHSQQTRETTLARIVDYARELLALHDKLEQDLKDLGANDG